MVGGGDSGVQCCANSGILEEILCVFDNQVLWRKLSLSIMCHYPKFIYKYYTLDSYTRYYPQAVQDR